MRYVAGRFASTRTARAVGSRSWVACCLISVFIASMEFMMLDFFLEIKTRTRHTQKSVYNVHKYKTYAHIKYGQFCKVVQRFHSADCKAALQFSRKIEPEFIAVQ